jgi:hypothetical protein
VSESGIVPSVSPDPRSPATIAREFRRLLTDGAVLCADGDAREHPEGLLEDGYVPRWRLDLFDCRFYVCRARQNPSLRYFVVYVVPPAGGRRQPRIHARIFYKDVSLVWRVASHIVWNDEELWIGKGDLTSDVVDGEEMVFSAESTTDLPLELQTALETLNQMPGRVPYDYDALEAVLRPGGPNRIAAFADFTEPRRRAMADPARRIHGGRRIARFARKNDPTSLVFARGFEPDFDRGVLECAPSRSSLYGGALMRYRILSTNRRIQYLFFAGPRHVWIVPPQATTTELSSFGVRVVDVVVDEDAFVPGYEYHYIDDSEEPPVLVSQIPHGYAGPPNPHDPDRADASPWLEKLPVVREFRRKVLGRRSAQGQKSALAR